MKRYEQSPITDGVSDIEFQTYCMARLANGKSLDFSGLPSALFKQMLRYDNIKITPEKPNLLLRIVMRFMPSAFMHQRNQQLGLNMRNKMLDGLGKNDYYADPHAKKMARLMFGLWGAGALLVPLVALSFIEGTHYRLLATCAFVMSFVVILTFLTDASYQDLMGAVAGFTAVLVVFMVSTV